MGMQYLGNMTFDISGSLRDYDYTKRSVVNLNNVVDSRQFEEMDSETIFRYLQEQMEIVSFGDYLKRFIYEGAGQGVPFLEVPEEYYIQVIQDSFAMNRAPHSFTPVKSRWKNIVRRWLRSDSVKRSTVFLLGFGLNMTDVQVSEFLTKVLKEQDFRFHDPFETICWYCFHHGYPYSMALSLQEFYESGEKEIEVNQDFWDSAGRALTVYLSNKNKMREYLAYLKICHLDSTEAAFYEFQKLYQRAAEAAGKVIKSDENELTGGRLLLGAHDIESILCSGMPLTESRNLSPVTKSTLSRQFDKKRMSRQRLARLLNQEAPVERFDIITLLFMDYAVNVEPEWPTERYMQFIDEANEILGRCGMNGIYPVNPYESFILMCLLTEEPLSVYNDVWELSYED